MKHYGFLLAGKGRGTALEAEVDAANIHDAIALAEEQNSGHYVMAGRCLDGYTDNLAERTDAKAVKYRTDRAAAAA